MWLSAANGSVKRSSAGARHSLALHAWYRTATSTLTSSVAFVNVSGTTAAVGGIGDTPR